MTHRITPQGDPQPGPANGHSARALALDEDSVLDHHIEELLGAFSDFAVVRLEPDE